PVQSTRYERRLGLLGNLENDFAARGAANAVAEHKKLYEKTRRLVLSPDAKSFETAGETQEIKDRYGDSQFGRGCLLARRLVEAGVTFVEVRSSGGMGVRNWDTHQDNFDIVTQHAAVVDPAFSALVADLKQRGMLETTLVVWMGEFGRTPRINPRAGRDHYPTAFNVVLAGGGVRGGQVIGKTDAGGAKVADRPVTVPDLFQSLCQSLKIN